MSKTIDPSSKRFVDTTVMPAGKYRHRMLCEIASTADGLLYLFNLTTTDNPPAFLGTQLRRSILRLLMREESQSAIRRIND